MIAIIRGKIIEKNKNTIVLMTSGGVGYEVRMSEQVILEMSVNNEIDILTYLVVRENSMELFGFRNVVEKGLFLNFLDVSGVGPKTALHILSLGDAEEIRSAVGRGDVDYLSKVSGIGRKTAERIVVELKNKMSMNISSSKKLKNSDVLADVIDGLVAMGYNVSQAREVARQLDTTNKSSEQLLKEALKSVK